MVEAIASLLDDGKVKLYCAPSFDRESWTRRDLPLEERARRHGHYEWWVLTKLVPFVQADSHTHAAARDRRLLRRLPRRELLPEARRSLSGRDRHERRLRRLGAGWRRARRSGLLQQPDGLRREPPWGPSRLAAPRRRPSSSSAGRGSGRTRPARSTRRVGSVSLLAEKGIPHEVDLWGHDVPHDWPSWRHQLAHHLPRFVYAERDRAAARHRGGLARGVRGARLAARPGRRPRAPHRADPQRAVRPALSPPLLDRHRPARVVVRPAARVAEEGRR